MRRESARKEEDYLFHEGWEISHYISTAFNPYEEAHVCCARGSWLPLAPWSSNHRSPVRTTHQLMRLSSAFLSFSICFIYRDRRLLSPHDALLRPYYFAQRETDLQSLRKQAFFYWVAIFSRQSSIGLNNASNAR